MTGSLRYPKSARLRYRTLVDRLFRDGHTIYEYPLRMVWLPLDSESLNHAFKAGIPGGIGNVQMLVTIPKRKVRKAVGRVLMRRRIRESFRLNRTPLVEAMVAHPEISTLSVAFIYLSDKEYPYADIQNRMRILIDKLISKL